MFAILISEKGGAERRETFHQPMVTVGRVQDNDLTLPKGNVSKRHCRLEWTDGRLVVTDEDSTNGTYVNRRRITQPTAVREGDRIYVGDFVLRFASVAVQNEALQAEALQTEALQTEALQTEKLQVPNASESQGALPSPNGEAELAKVTAPSKHGPAFTPSLPPPAPAPRGDTRYPDTLAPRLAASELGHVTAEGHPAADAHADVDEPDVSTTAGNASKFPVTTLLAPSAHVTPVRAAARALIEEVFRRVEPRVFARALDRESSDRLERILVEQANQLPAMGHALTAEHTTQAVSLARSETMGLGPIEALIGDESVTEIIVTGARGLSVAREGFIQDGSPFCHPRAVDWVVGRLCQQEGLQVDDSEPLLHRVLGRAGFELHAVRDAACTTGALLRLRRWRKSSVQLDDLVQVGTLSRAMATFLRHCVMARANVMIVGRRDSGADDLLSALTALVARERLAWMSWGNIQHLPPQGSEFSLITVSPDIDADALLATLSSMGQRVAAAYPTAGGAHALLLAAVGGLDGLILLHEARSSEAALTLISHRLASPELSAENVRCAVVQAFDVVIEVARLGDGRSRVMRVGEPSLLVTAGEDGGGDIFRFVVERTATGGSIEGSFTAAARATTLLKSFRARGIAVEEALFLRPASD